MNLDARKLRILHAIIDEYITSGNPVGSKSISQNREFQLSSATIRNEMADLEELGYLAQPYTSAGRVPSDKAYRLYVDQMLQRAQLTEDEAKLMRTYCHDRINNVQSVMRETANALSSITRYTAMVLMPEMDVNRLKHLQLVPLNEDNALVVVVTDAGVATDAVIRIPHDMMPDELERISRQITSRYRNCRMTMLGDRLVRDIGGELESRRAFLSDLINTIQMSTEPGGHLVELSGATNMLKLPEYSDMGKAMHFLKAIEGKDILYRMLKKASVMEFTITIGAENEYDDLQDCSIVTATYRIGDVPFGTFGVVGPTRMQYGKVISAMECMRKSLSDVLCDILEDE